MPVRPENRDRYPDDWKTISDRIRFGRAWEHCECDGRCGASFHTYSGRCVATMRRQPDVHDGSG